MNQAAGTQNWRKGNRVFLRVFVVFGSLQLALTALYGLFVIPLQQESLLKVMYSQAATVSRSITQASVDAMLTDDFGFIVEHNLQVLQNNRSIEAVVIVPKRGTAMRIVPAGWFMDERFRTDLPKNADEVESYGIVTDTDGSRHYRYASPIKFSGVSWGAILIDFDTGDYDRNIAESYRQLGFVAFLAVLVILTGGYFFARWLTRPIATISQAASDVASGDLTAYVELRRNDEIGQLSASFNLMVAALRENRDRLHNYSLDLEQKVTERTRALDELNRTLDQRVRDEVARRKEQESLLIHQSRLAAMGEMIGAIAHQWRQPLNALSLVLQNLLMQHRLGTLNEESMQRMSTKASQLIERMSHTIDDFRNFFKPNKVAAPFRLVQVIRSAAEILEGVLKNHSIELTIECDEDVELFGFAGEFSQVVLNLIGNAKDALLTTRPGLPHIAIRVSRDGERIQIEVEDNGGGIDPAIIHKIFEPYVTTKEEGKGSGIGLYMSKMIVESNMGGTIAAQNTTEGARFTLILPARPPAI